MMGKIKDLTGMRFGRLMAIRIAGKTRGRHLIWECICSCGQTTEVQSGNLLRGRIQSCGCLQRELLKKASTKHGDGRHPGQARLYRIWSNMKSRCLNPNNKDYKYYGGRGITIYSGWKDDYRKFKTFALSSGYADNLTIDRIDNNGNYEASNCQWITKSENSKKSNLERRKR